LNRSVLTVIFMFNRALDKPRTSHNFAMFVPGLASVFCPTQRRATDRPGDQSVQGA